VVHDGASAGASAPAAGDALAGARCVIGKILELAIPFASLGLVPGEAVELVAHVIEGGQRVETLPDSDLVRFQVPDDSFAASMWSA
jgi:hypothetical protein